MPVFKTIAAANAYMRDSGIGNVVNVFVDDDSDIMLVTPSNEPMLHGICAAFANVFTFADNPVTVQPFAINSEYGRDYFHDLAALEQNAAALTSEQYSELLRQIADCFDAQGIADAQGIEFDVAWHNMQVACGVMENEPLFIFCEALGETYLND